MFKEFTEHRKSQQAECSSPLMVSRNKERKQAQLLR
jgi:hypothetical protein